MPNEKMELLLEFFEVEDCPAVQIPLMKMKKGIGPTPNEPQVGKTILHPDQGLQQAFGNNLTLETPQFPKPCNRFGLTPGIVLDIRKNWNFTNQSDRDVIREQLKWKKPMFLIVGDE